MAKIIQSSKLSAPPVRALDLVGAFGPLLDEIVSPTLQVLDVSELPYTARGNFIFAASIAAVAAQLSKISLGSASLGRGRCAVIRRIHLRSQEAANTMNIGIYRDALPATGTTYPVYFSDWRRTATGIPQPTQLTGKVGAEAAAVAGTQISFVGLNAGQWADVFPNFVLTPGGNALVLATTANQRAFSAVIEGEVFEIRRPDDLQV